MFCVSPVNYMHHMGAVQVAIHSINTFFPYLLKKNLTCRCAHNSGVMKCVPIAGSSVCYPQCTPREQACEYVRCILQTMLDHHFWLIIIFDWTTAVSPYSKDSE